MWKKRCDECEDTGGRMKSVMIRWKDEREQDGRQASMKYGIMEGVTGWRGGSRWQVKESEEKLLRGRNEDGYWHLAP